MILDAILAMFSGSKNDDEDQEGGGVGKTLWRIMSIIVVIAAAYLSWRCNTEAGTATTMKVLFAILSGVFGHMYLAFYVIYRLVLGNKCV